MHVIGGLGVWVWAQWDELRHAAAVIGTAFYVGVQPRSWVPDVRSAFSSCEPIPRRSSRRSSAWPVIERHWLIRKYIEPRQPNTRIPLREIVP